MSELPRAVQRQLDAAEAMAASQAQPAPPVTPAPVQVAAPPAPAQPPAPSPQPPAPPPAQPTDNWEQRYRTLQGMFQREMPELRAANVRFQSELVTAREQIAALSAAVNKPSARPEPAPAEIDPRDARAFGEDMVEMVNRNARQALAAAEAGLQRTISAIEGRIQALEQAVSGVSKRTEVAMDTQFYASLDQLVPNWKSINADPEWLAWLGEVDEVYNIPRQTALDAAFERLNAANVAAVFRQFIKTRPAKPATPAQPSITPSEGGGGPVAPNPPPARQIISSASIQKYYDDVAKGRYRGREAEADRIEQEINLAAREGRVI